MGRHFNLPGAWLDFLRRVAYVIGKYRKPDKLCHIFAEGLRKMNRNVVLDYFRVVQNNHGEPLDNGDYQALVYIASAPDFSVTLGSNLFDADGHRKMVAIAVEIDVFSDIAGR